MYVFGKKEIAAFVRVANSGKHFRYRGGEGGECDTFEKELCEKLDARYSLLLTSGTAALICGLTGLDIGPGDEVIVPAYTFMATPLAVLAAGAIPVIAEVDDSLTLDPVDVERKITARTKCIIPVHMMGLPSNMNALCKIARRHRITILEDSCQAVGGSYGNKRLTTLGNAGAFSFNYFKIIGAGEGGALVTSDRLLYEKALIHHDGGSAFRGHQLLIKPFCGSSFRVSEFVGAVMRAQLARLDGILKRLRANKAALLAELDGCPAFTLNPVHCQRGDCGVTIALRFESERAMRRALKELKQNGISSDTPYDSGIHVYSRWTPILEQRGAADPRKNPYRLTTKKYHYAKDMCPRTLAILASTLYIPINYQKNAAQHRQLGRHIRKLLQ
ncbi:MAG: DegT/DnrJ/EryC1/StrS family aminotransferase [Kiritimatiellae bacterium]|nr:DegT/DnrJ/EryC1/StrS family aminotransferase [Kiritimatiellia bacterium]